MMKILPVAMIGLVRCHFNICLVMGMFKMGDIPTWIPEID